MFWELIRANRRKSLFLIIGMASCLAAIGYAMGSLVDPEYGGVYGILIAGAVFTVQILISYFCGDSIMLSSSQAAEISRDIHPQLFNIVEEMKISSGLKVMPKIFIIPDQGYNAFATGLRQEKSSVAVTAGMLGALNRDELQGVVAHEMSHILNRDVMYMTFAGVMLGSIQLMVDAFFRGWVRSSSSVRSRSRGSSSNGQAQALILILAVLLAILGPLLAQIFYFSLSRKREYLADASAARLTRYPEGLASALEKISFKNRVAVASKVTSALFIQNPLHTGLNRAGLFDTHPPIQSRILILRKMSGADFVNYQKAFSEILHKNTRVIPKTGLQMAGAVPLRAPSAEAALPAAAPSELKLAAMPQHEVMDLIRATNEFSFLVCPCGVKVKVPSEVKHPKLKCLRCGRWMEIPLALGAVVDQALKGKDLDKPRQDMTALTYERKTAGWETLKCSCGRKLQLSPLFSGAHLECVECGRQIRILTPEKKSV
jgi:heat shock protein HtpX